MFVVLYTLLFVLFLFLLNSKIQRGPEPLEEMEAGPVSDAAGHVPRDLPPPRRAGLGRRRPAAGGDDEVTP